MKVKKKTEGGSISDDQKVAGSILGISGRAISSSGVNFPCKILFRYSLNPSVKCRWQVTAKHAYTIDPTKSEWADYVVQARYGNPLRKRAHTQLVKERSSTVLEAR